MCSAITWFALFAVLSFGNCETNNSEPCIVEAATANCGENFEFGYDLGEDVTHLIVRSAILKNISQSNLENLHSLTTIDLTDCAIEHIEPDAFSELENLEELNLAANTQLQIPEDGPFISSKSLRKLNLSEITIDELPDNIFAELPNLEEIDLSASSLTNFSSQPLEKLSKLTTLFLSKDSAIEIESLCNNTNLKEIVLKIEDEDDERINCTVKLLERQVKVETDEEDATTIPLLNVSDSSQTTETQNETVTESDMDELPLETEITTKTHEDHEETTEEIKTTTEEPEHKTDEEKPTPIPDEENKTEIDNSATTLSETEPEVTTISEVKEIAPEVVAQPKINVFASDESSTKAVLAQVNANVEEPPVEGESTLGSKDPVAAQSNGVNIVLGIILCVMIVGAIGFSYKFIKNRRSGYRNANTEDVEEGKELQNIVAHHTDPEQN